MRISLRFNFYATWDTLDSEINNIHLKCLEFYKHIFNDVKVCVSIDDTNDKQLIKEVQERFFNVFKGESIQLCFDVQKNEPEYRESLFFKKEVVDKFNTYDLVFFAHNKGMTNVKHFDKNTINIWVVAMYYFNLNFFEDVKRCLLNDIFYTYGTFLTKEMEYESFTKYGYRYLGTFIWFNGKRISNMYNEFPKLDSRLYSENFIGNTNADMRKCASYKGTYIISENNLYYNIKYPLHLLYSDELLNEFYEFYNNIIQKL